MNKKKVLCFDFDGTLADSEPLEKESIVQTLEYFGNESVTKENLSDHYGPTETGILQMVLGEEESVAAIPHFYATYSELQEQYLKKSEEIEEMLKTVHEKHPETILLLVTGRDAETLDISLSYLGFGSFFVKTYTGSKEGINKDESMKKAMRDFDCDKEDMLYIGDTLADVRVMKENGFDLFSAGYYHDKSYQEKLRKENENTFTSIRELKEALLAIL